MQNRKNTIIKKQPSENFDKLKITLNNIILNSLKSVNIRINSEKKINKEQRKELDDLQKKLFEALSPEQREEGIEELVYCYSKGPIAQYILDYLASKDTIFIKQRFNPKDDFTPIPKYCFLYDTNENFFKEYIKKHPYKLQELNASYTNHITPHKTEEINFLDLFLSKMANNSYLNFDKYLPINIEHFKSIDYLNKDELMKINVEPECLNAYTQFYTEKEVFFEKLFDKKFPLIGSEIIYSLVDEIFCNQKEKNSLSSQIQKYKKTYQSIIDENQKKIIDTHICRLAFNRFIEYLEDNSDSFIDKNGHIKNQKIISLINNYKQILESITFNCKENNCEKTFIDRVHSMKYKDWHQILYTNDKESLEASVDIININIVTTVANNNKSKSVLKI